MGVLVVDDDAISRMALVAVLARVGAAITGPLAEADDGEAAWERLQTGERPLLCCCDIRMPRLSGLDLLRRLKACPRLADLPLVLVSSASDRDTVAEAVQLGAAGYVLKPFQADEAAAKLGLLLQQALARRAEPPEATGRRLGLGPARLVAYLDAFDAQLLALVPGDPAAPQPALPLDRLHTACLTLGLWLAAALVDRLRGADPATVSVPHVLADLRGQVLLQRARIVPARPAAVA